MSQPAFDFGPDEGSVVEEPTETTWSVAELADAINGVLRRGFEGGVWVRGEIQGWNERGPHAYFRLVEETDTGKAVLNVQLFAPQRSKLRPLLEKHRLRLADGLKIRIRGQLDFYGPSGQLGLKMSGIDARFTLGDLAVQRAEVVRRLVATGLYDANRQQRLSVAPLRIGVVTSVGSAAWADFVHEIERSNFGFQLRAVDVRVQGDRAVQMVSAAIGALGRRSDLDAIVVVRGGGARSELATFDHEDIAVAIATCPLPVLTGLGHEIDRSIADEVAFLALKTPTACATALVERVGRFVERTERSWAAVVERAAQQVERAGGRLDDLDAAIRLRTDAALTRSADRLQLRRRRLRDASLRGVERAEATLEVAGSGLRRVPARLDVELRHLAALETQVRLVDPVRTLARGWSITRGPDGRAIRSIDGVQPGAVLVTTFADGSAVSRVETIESVAPVETPTHSPTQETTT